jgi:hypothetical protein
VRCRYQEPSSRNSSALAKEQKRNLARLAENRKLFDSGLNSLNFALIVSRLPGGGPRTVQLRPHFVLALPETARVPLQPPEAAREVVFVADQLSVAALPLCTVAGLAFSVPAGAGAATVTVADPLPKISHSRPLALHSTQDRVKFITLRANASSVQTSVVGHRRHIAQDRRLGFNENPWQPHWRYCKCIGT